MHCTEAVKHGMTLEFCSYCNSHSCYIGELATHRTFPPKTLFNISLHFTVHDPSSFSSQIRANTQA